MKASAIAFIAFLVSNVGHQTHATSIKMDYLPAAIARTDPIIITDCLSDHVHTFYGPQLVRPETDHAALINSPDDINTGNVVENKSLYWHPTVYSYNRDTKTFTADEMAQSSVYYIWENDFNPKSFPNGFKMIAGLNPNDPNNFPNAEAECVDPTPCTRSDGCYTENTFFPATACSELEVSMSFPTCWDGVSLDSADHQSHVRYTLNGELDGPCPESHPHRFPQIQLFFRIMPYSGGWHTFSDMSSVFHADYISGWDETKLQEVLDNCQTESVAASPDSFCDEFLTFRDAPKCKDESVCDFGDPQLLAKLKAFQPPPMDVKSTVSAEETTVVVGELPRGSCTGTLISNNNNNGSSSNSTTATGSEDNDGPEDGDEDSAAAAASDEEEGGGDEDPGEEEEEVDSNEASGEEEEEASGDGDEASGEGETEEDDNEASGEEEEEEVEEEVEASGDGNDEQASEEGETEKDGNDEASSPEEEEEEASGDGDGNEQASEEGETGEEDSHEDEEAEDEVPDDEDPEDEAGEEEEEQEYPDEDEDDEEEPVGRVRVSSTLGNNNIPPSSSQTTMSCHLTCMDNFDTCQSSILSICENYFQACQSECLEEEATGEIGEDELLHTCLDEWCMDDKDICYSEAETRCHRRRTNCLRKC